LTAFIRERERAWGRVSTPGPAADISTLSDWLGRVPSVHEFKALLKAALSFCWGSEVRPGSLPAPELNHVAGIPDLGHALDGSARS